MSLRRGDIHWIEFPPTTAREQTGRRPAIVVQSDSAPPLPTVFVVPLTSNPRADRFPGPFAVEPAAGTGLPLRSIALAFQMRAIDRRRVGEHLGALRTEDIRTLDTLLRSLLAL